MSTSWQHVRPIDRYQVRLAGSASLFQIKTLYQLYQPLVGHLAVALYVTLWSETEGDYRFTAEKRHDWLMKEMAVTLDKIYDARLRLEAVGLVRTYQMNKEDYRSFTYELYPPLPVERFFEDDILSVWLYNQVGSAHFTRLRARFSRYFSNVRQGGSAVEVTKPFYEVFTSIHPSELMVHPDSQTKQELEEARQRFPIPEEKSADSLSTTFDHYPLNVQLIKSFMMKGIDTEKIFSPTNVIEIKKIAFFYGLDEQQMAHLIQDALGTGNHLNLNELRRLAKRYYRAKYDGTPQIRFNREHTFYSTEQMEQREGETAEEQHLLVLERLSPLQLLSAYQGGGKVAEADERLVEELIFEYQLKPSVVNVLLEYILLTNQFRLPRHLVTKVAAHWKRLNITDMRQALELAKKEHQQYKTWQEKRQQENGTSPETQKVTNSKKTKVRKATMPDWIAKQESEADVKPSAPPDEAAPFSEAQKRERIKSLLKALGEWEE
jgi:replication initiation and membrane attachment protein